MVEQITLILVKGLPCLMYCRLGDGRRMQEDKVK